MSEQRPLFSESWHRVAGQRLRLRPSVTIRRQAFRGEQWHIAQDTFTNSFFRFRPEAYDFIARLDGTRTVEEIWMGCLERSPERAPGQGEIVSMLAQLYQANLLATDTPGDTARLFERHQKFQRRQLASQIFGIFFLRIRLFDPNPLLNRTWPALRWLASKSMALVWLGVVFAGVVVTLSHWDRALDQSQAVLAPGNLLLLYAAFMVAKLIHEFGHAYAVKAFGGEVHAMGVTLLVFTPIPYVDATAAWAFRERWKRVMVGLGGMIPELFYAAVAAFVWAGTGPGTLNSLAYNTMIVASVSTIIFNLNPLLRFDGYYVLADLIDSPNLQPRSQRQWLHLIENHAFATNQLESPARTRVEAGWLTVYGAASWVYRLMVTVAIILLVADRYFGIGLLAGALTFVGAFVMPLVGAVRYLVREPRLERVRRRAWLVSGGALAAVLLFLGLVPLPHHFRAPGVVRAAGSREIYSQVAGWAVELPAVSGRDVAPGELLMRQENPELDLALAAAEADLEQARARERQMLSELAAGIAPMRLRRQAAELKLERLTAEKDSLEVRAPVGGTWTAPRSDEWRHALLPRGVRVGEIVGHGPDWEFFAVVSQEDASQLFGAAKDGAEVRFQGTAGEPLPVSSWRVIPGRQDTLPSLALGWAARGPVKIKQDDSHGLRTDEPFFLVVGRVPGRVLPEDGDAKLLWQGRTGQMRFALPWSPLLVRWTRSFRQLLQDRYQI
ncbi:MAG TPA: M50 family metallopeptidase [Opitutaceae bacterium]